MKIITAVVNNPDFIEIQYHTLKKYFQGEYEFIVFNDAKEFPDFTNGGDVNIKIMIEEMCNKYNIKCINIPNEHHKIHTNACIRCADSMNFILEYQKKNVDKYLLIDSDMFLVDYFNPNKYEKYDCAIVLQRRDNSNTDYFWNGIYYFNMNLIKNIELMNWNTCLDCDVGGEMRRWLIKQMDNNKIPDVNKIRWTNENFNTENTYFIKHLWSCTWDINELPENFKNKKKIVNFIKNDIRNTNGKFFCEIYDNIFLHYRAGGNWRIEDNVHKCLVPLLKDSILNDDN